MCGKHAGIRVDRVPGKWPAQNGADANLNIHPSTCYVFLMYDYSLFSLVVRESRGDAWKLSITFFLVVGGGSRGGVTPCQQVRAPTHTRKTVSLNFPVKGNGQARSASCFIPLKVNFDDPPQSAGAGRRWGLNVSGIHESPY